MPASFNRRKEIFDFAAQFGDQAALEKYNICQDTLRLYRKSIQNNEFNLVGNNKKENTANWTEDDKSASGFIITAIKPRTLRDAAELFQVDLNAWEPDRMVINQWDVTNRQGKSFTNYQVKVWFKRRKFKPDNELAAVVFRQMLADYTPPIINYSIKPDKEGSLLEITTFDLHLGKLCWYPESGENYDVKIAQKRFNKAICDLLIKAKPYNISKILLAIGQDFLNADTWNDLTTSGTAVNSDVRWQKRYKLGQTILVDTIYLLRKIAPVDIIITPGNHDFQTSYFLGEYLAAWFRNASTINIDNREYERKYYNWNNILLGYTHLQKIQVKELFELMAQEADKQLNKAVWSNTIYREWHVGHFHHEIVDRIGVREAEDFKGVIVRALKSLSGTDSWHYSHGYTGSIKGAEAFIWHPKNGLTAQLHHCLVI